MCEKRRVERGLKLKRSEHVRHDCHELLRDTRSQLPDTLGASYTCSLQASNSPYISTYVGCIPVLGVKQIENILLNILDKNIMCIIKYPKPSILHSDTPLLQNSSDLNIQLTPSILAWQRLHVGAKNSS